MKLQREVRITIRSSRSSNLHVVLTSSVMFYPLIILPHRRKKMFKAVMLAAIAAVVLSMAGCASVPMANEQQSAAAKTFPAPDEGNAGLYVYRDSFAGKALKKDIFVDGKCLGESADKVFFYTQVPGNTKHTISTESEFSPNDLALYMKAGVNYFIRQYIKIGVFVGGANLETVSVDKGKSEVTTLKMASNGQCSR